LGAETCFLNLLVFYPCKNYVVLGEKYSQISRGTRMTVVLQELIWLKLVFHVHLKAFELSVELKNACKGISCLF
jgi:hypothetical protein